MKRILGNCLIRALAPILCALLLHTAAVAQISVFDPATSAVTLPLLIKDGVAYNNATLSLPANAAWSFTAPGTVSGLSSKVGASYSTAAATLNIPYLQLDNSYFYDVKLQLPSGQPWKLLSYGDFNQIITQATPLTFPITTTVDNWWATDTGGVMSYKFDNGQVWRIVTDDPCMPPLTVPTGAPPPGKATVWIYPNPDNAVANYLLITSYNDGVHTAEESCIITPVFVPGLEVAATGQPYDLSQTALTGVIGKSYDFYIAGGTKPYMLKIDNPAVASVQLLPQAAQDIGGQTVRVTMLRPGAATLTVYDFNRLKKQVAITAQTDLALMPGSIEVTAGMPPVDVFIVGGIPPFTLYNPSATLVSNSDAVPINLTESKFTLTFLRDTGGLKMPILVVDSAGAMATVTVSVTSSTVVTNTGTGTTTTATSSSTGKPLLK